MITLRSAFRKSDKFGNDFMNDMGILRDEKRGDNENDNGNENENENDDTNMYSYLTTRTSIR